MPDHRLSTQPLDVFISYARADGRDFTTKLRQQLEMLSFSIWLDVISMAAGDDWWPQIIRAIEGVRTMVLIITPAALRKDSVVRWEWAHARHVGTHILPVVFDGNILNSKLSDVPRWLSRADCLVLDENAPGFEITWDRFIGQIKNPPPRQPMPLMAPLPPDQLVHRSALREALQKRLVDANGDPRPVKVALYGGPGFGKSTLVQALCHDPEIVEAFSGGILWVTLGENGQQMVLPGLNAMITALGGAALTGEDEAAAQLAQRLERRDCLIVLDDVWDTAHAERFLRRGDLDRSARLTTTREPAIAAYADDAGEPIYIPEMLPEEAVQVLVNWLPERHRPAADDTAARQPLEALAARLGEWPLLLQIFGGVLRDEIARCGSLGGALAWVNEGLNEQGLTAFDRENATERNQALRASLDASLRHFTSDEKQRLYELSIFPEDAAVPQDVAVRLWAGTANLKPFAARQLLRRLAHFFQMRAEQQDGPVVIRFHDAMREVLAGQLGSEAAYAAHAALLRAYNPEGKPWPELPHDGYLYHRLAYHLLKAGRRAELHALLTDSPAWMEAKFAACVGDNAYAADLELALAEFRDPFRDPLPAPQIVTLLRLFTARQVVNARVGFYNDTDLQTLVWLGRKAEALAHARLRPDDRERFDGLLAVYRALEQTGQADPALLDEAAQTARSIVDDFWRAEALRALAAALAQAGRFAAAVAALGPRSPEKFVQAVAAWSPGFEQVEKGLSVAVLIEASWAGSGPAGGRSTRCWLLRPTPTRRANLSGDEPNIPGCQEGRGRFWKAHPHSLLSYESSAALPCVQTLCLILLFLLRVCRS